MGVAASPVADLAGLDGDAGDVAVMRVDLVREHVAPGAAERTLRLLHHHRAERHPAEIRSNEPLWT